MKEPRSRCESGFTLTELAIVLVIVALLIGGMLAPLSAQRDAQNITETQKQLVEIKEALLGFAIVNGRLPCPAAAGATGVESPAGGGPCTNPFDGFLPAISLSLHPLDAQGYAIDRWNNRIRYAVTTANGSAATTASGIRNRWVAGNPLNADLSICATSVGITGAGNLATCAVGANLSDSAVAVVFSTGRNGAETPTSADETANLPASNRRAFVSATPGTGFDDIVVWISSNLLMSRLLAAGRLQ